MANNRPPIPPDAAGKVPRVPADAEAWVFDLDNTLYPAEVSLYPQIDVRMRAYIAQFLGLDSDAARVVQKRYFREYGTSLRGMMDRHGMDPAPYLDAVHDIDISVLPADPNLEAALAALPGRKIIFTNASEAHAERVTERLGIRHHFSGIFDIVAAEYRPKPQAHGYDRLLKQHGLDPRRCVMVEDIARNLEPAAALGMTTVWVRTGSDVGAEGADGGFVDHVVDDLGAWLGQLVAAGV
jgi:putative hydrolase of the HAD superfamily